VPLSVNAVTWEVSISDISILLKLEN